MAEQLLSPGVLIVGAWLLALALVLLGAIAGWVYRLPGTTYSDYTLGPRGPNHPRFLHLSAERINTVRPEKRRLVYWLTLTGVTIFAISTAGVVLFGLLTGEWSQ